MEPTAMESGVRRKRPKLVSDCSHFGPPLRPSPLDNQGIQRAAPALAPAPQGVEACAGLATRYYLPTLEEFRAIHDEDFTEIECRHGDYELAGRCPTLVLERRG